MQSDTNNERRRSLDRYGADLSPENIKGPIISLNLLYKNLPATSGCEKCKEHNGDNMHYCCKENSPSMSYIEFINIMEFVFKKFNKYKRKKLLFRAFRNYLSQKTNKGCIFYDDGCTVYDRRPAACRFYGIVDDEAWNNRVASVKKHMGEDYNPRPQCNLVTTKSGKKVTGKQEEYIAESIDYLEEKIGVQKFFIQQKDKANGSYRTPHDHLLLHFFDDNFMSRLCQLRLSQPTEEVIEKFIETLSKQKM